MHSRKLQMIKRFIASVHCVTDGNLTSWKKCLLLCLRLLQCRYVSEQALYSCFQSVWTLIWRCNITAMPEKAGKHRFTYVQILEVDNAHGDVACVTKDSWILTFATMGDSCFCLCTATPQFTGATRTNLQLVCTTLTGWLDFSYAGILIGIWLPFVGDFVAQVRLVGDKISLCMDKPLWDWDKD